MSERAVQYVSVRLDGHEPKESHIGHAVEVGGLHIECATPIDATKLGNALLRLSKQMHDEHKRIRGSYRAELAGRPS